MSKQKAIIIGAGPAGLTAAYELLAHTDIQPIVLEMSDQFGGISQTVNYKGNRIDIGGHRFFSKIDRVMNWWVDMLPMASLEGLEENEVLKIHYQGKERTLDSNPNDSTNGELNPDRVDDLMLVRARKSRIFYQRKFFDYPLSLSLKTLLNLGPISTMRIGFSYIKSRIFPICNEQNLEHFFINRFGKELYLKFFKSYTEKVWGVPCQDISAEWGAQRIKGLSITSAVKHALGKMLPKKKSLSQKETETSLIERFLYPKFGPGQMWETCAKKVEAQGGEIYKHQKVTALQVNEAGDGIASLTAINTQTGKETTYQGDYFFSTMPVKELIRSLETPVPENVKEVSEGLQYRDFLTVGLLLNKLKVHEETKQGKQLLSDTWIYIQEPDVEVGRLQIFNNWSPYMVNDPEKVWIGLEYFCYEGDKIWSQSDDDLKTLGKEEMAKIGIIDPGEVLDGTVIRMPKSYPAYFGSYDRFDEIRTYTDTLKNLFLIGRNGMHRYNNQDHSMMAAMIAVENIIAGRTDKSNIWDINTEQTYHEEKEKTAPTS